jgi:DOPA 4,5-dioxygenase
MTKAPTEIGAIEAYHAHVYYDPATTRDVAATLRQWVEQRFTVTMGRWHDVPVGPHVRAMYLIVFTPDQFPALVPFLMLNRMGLTILIHPETDRPLADHLERAMWLGEVLPLKSDMLPEVRAVA